jgi:hypothetical protein
MIQPLSYACGKQVLVILNEMSSSVMALISSNILLDFIVKHTGSSLASTLRIYYLAS